MTPSCKYEGWIFTALLLLGLAGIISTYPYLSHVFDEAPHIGTGMEWWWKQRYLAEPLHPPFVRLMAASLLFFTGKYHVVQDITPEQFWWQGADIFYADGTYEWNVVLARLGVLPFYVVSCFLVHRWARALYGAVPALVSLALYVTLPTVSAHAGVAMTDMGYAAMFFAAVMACVYWLKNPTIKNTLLAGIMVALMVGSKYSSLVQFPAAMALIFIANYLAPTRAFTLTKAHYQRAIIVVEIFLLTLLSLFFFSYQPLFDGLKQLYEKNKGGHATWLFHHLYGQGVWYFFSVVLFFKTPIIFLAATLLSNLCIVHDLRRRQQNIERLFPLLAVLGLLLVSMTSNINIGVRHVLPVYPLLAVPCGYGLWWLWQRKNEALRALILLLFAWQSGEFIAWFPDRLAYYNEIGLRMTDGNPERISPDNDVDAGQGFGLLGEAIKRRNIHTLYGCFWLGGSVRRMEVSLHLSPQPCPTQKPSGWLAISRVELMLYPEKYSWLTPYKPVENVGRTLLLYHFD